MPKEVPAAPWLRLCVTGGIACGKSLVGAYLEAIGVAVIDADAVCHGLMRAGAPLFGQIVAAFGREILAPDGGIDRAVLGRRVFGDATALGRLNALLHPAARDAIERWVLARREEARRNMGPGWRGGVAAIIPLLYEAAWEAAWDRVICVAAPIALQRERLRSKGYTEEEVHNRLAAQLPVEEKMKRADYVVFNAGTLSCAQIQTVQVMQQIVNHVENSDGR
ncbi:MAG: dephospho-CoA kinase [Kiritimatiellae bacterium]|nr:dephospho-CoA kinase [Kiritimatiellia bacterium]